jgi:hypothetical protein
MYGVFFGVTILMVAVEAAYALDGDGLPTMVVFGGYEGRVAMTQPWIDHRS